MRKQLNNMLMGPFFSKSDQVWPARVAFESFLIVSGTDDSHFFIVLERTVWEQKRYVLATRKAVSGRWAWLAPANQMLFTFVLAHALDTQFEVGHN